MKVLKKIKSVSNNPTRIILYTPYRGLLSWMKDDNYLKLIYRAMMGKKLDLQNPQTFNEKIQWLKLYDRNPLYTNLVDKYDVKKYISETIGEEYIIPTIGVWDKFEDIDFSKLPNQFVLKCTHDSGGLVICEDKNKLDIEMVREKINKSLKINYYYSFREWPYKNVKPRIICEQLIKTNDGRLPSDYKFHCFNGEPDNVMVCIERETGNPKFYFFDKQWILLRYNKTGVAAPEKFTLPKPSQLEEMFALASKLSKEIPFVRVDLYCEQDKVYFGEFTFYPDSGFDANILESTDIYFGSKIRLENVK